MNVGVVDYEAGNLRSVETALERVGADFQLSGDPDVLRKADRLIFPGVGEAASAVKVLKDRGLDELIRDFYASGKPMLGICLGSHIILERSEERDAECLGLLPGRAVRFPNQPGYKVPHMGWNRIVPAKPHHIFRNIPSGISMYFVHSFYPSPSSEEDVLAFSDYILDFPAAIGRDNLVATQFHPEKSGEWGLRILGNFLSWE
ncbi:MAG: imidazole glycerol phosphate synthase subunit HisH [Spirochaetales bacterium]|nr:imidazole glycerol phosphate synthase subunit HisH [Spirochaetales bacterium]MCF7937178.1 imidazole glycerol phosphate synthase subunit HisH [Spirochaetales bacterium]